jgi:outer membrane lipoprotein-sorting protein
MNRFLTLIALTLALGLSASLPASAQSAAQRLEYYDKTTYSGRIDAIVELYAPPDKSGKYGQPQRYPAQLLFARPDRFRMTVRPGQKSEYRAVAEAGILRWLYPATGLSGKAQIETLVDPLAIAMLGTAGELLRYGEVKDLPSPGTSKIFGARLLPRGWSSGVESGVVWFSSVDGKPIGFQFRMADGAKVHVSVLGFDQNVKTTPQDFQL